MLWRFVVTSTNDVTCMGVVKSCCWGSTCLGLKFFQSLFYCLQVLCICPNVFRQGRVVVDDEDAYRLRIQPLQVIFSQNLDLRGIYFHRHLKAWGGKGISRGQGRLEAPPVQSTLIVPMSSMNQEPTCHGNGKQVTFSARPAHCIVYARNASSRVHQAGSFSSWSEFFLSRSQWRMEYGGW